mmetsp:Transcript_1723/g.4300  ORF Transcript_1723/g.4300 Transcript_1723/m.4300 type:complete len:640 (-) Transcript_1723:37-1956(-)
MSDSDEDHHAKHPPLPGHKVHVCTDIMWLGVFALACIGQTRMVDYGLREGDTRKLARGYDYQGKLCGVDTPGDNLFHCQSATGDILLTSPICVDACPSSGNLTHSCYDPSVQAMTEFLDYDTKEVLRYCMPDSIDILTELLKDVVANSTSFLTPGHLAWAANMVSQARRAWLPVLISAHIAVIAGYAYLLLLRWCTSTLVYACEFIFVVGFWGVGGYLVYVSATGGQDGLEGTGDSKQDAFFGVACLLIGFIAVCVFLCANRNMATAVGCIEATCECMFEEPTLLLEPFVSLGSKLLIFWICIPGLFGLLATGDLIVAGARDGFARRFSYTAEEQLYIVGECLMIFWLLEICHAMSQYTLAWSTQIWYFTPYVNGRKLNRQRCAVFRAYFNAVRYHLGTLAFGALMSGTLRPFRHLISYIAKASQNEANPLSVVLGRCCGVCINCYRKFLERLNKTAYMDVAITSSNYCVSATRALAVLTEEVPALAVLNGAQAVFQLALLGIVSFTGAFTTFVLSKHWAILNDQQSPYYVQDPMVVSVISGIASGLIAVSFTLVFDTVGDTILYCFATEQRRHNQVDHAKYSQANNQSSSYFSWLLGSGSATQQEEKRVDYAPRKLRDLIASRQKEEDEVDDDASTNS